MQLLFLPKDHNTSQKKTAESVSSLLNKMVALRLQPQYYTRGRCSINGVINYLSATTLVNSGET